MTESTTSRQGLDEITLPKVYLPGPRVKVYHLLRHYNSSANSRETAVCGMTPYPDYWRGSGSQDEIETLEFLDCCRNCLRLYYKHMAPPPNPNPVAELLRVYLPKGDTAHLLKADRRIDAAALCGRFPMAWPNPRWYGRQDPQEVARALELPLCQSCQATVTWNQEQAQKRTARG